MYVMKWEKIRRAPDVFIVYMYYVGVCMNVCTYFAQSKEGLWNLPGQNGEKHWSVAHLTVHECRF